MSERISAVTERHLYRRQQCMIMDMTDVSSTPEQYVMIRYVRPQGLRELAAPRGYFEPYARYLEVARLAAGHTRRNPELGALRGAMSTGTSGMKQPLYRVASSPVVGYPLLLAWQRGWLPAPGSERTARLRDGRLLRLDLGDRTQRTMYLGLFEPEETKLVREILRPGDLFVDVGAHVGWFTTLAARRVGESGRVVACEPFPANAARLRQNIADGDYTNVDFIGQALGSTAGVLELSAGADSGGVTAVEWSTSGRISVPMTTLDDVTAGLGDIALLKVDVEGWEAHVLRGAVQALSRTRRVLIEINRPALLKVGSSREELMSLLKRAGFVTFEPVSETGLRRLRRSEVSNLLVTRPSAARAQLPSRPAFRVQFLRAAAKIALTSCSVSSCQDRTE